MECKTKSILGISESDLVKYYSEEQRNNAFVKNVKGVHCFENQKTKELFPYGNFETVSVAELRARVKNLPVKKNDTARRPLLLKLEARSGVDIGELQGTLTSNNEAMVQVASNFNCLENGSRMVSPDCGRLVDICSQDCTQGPAAVFGTLPSYIYRTHFVGGSVNLLSGAPNYFGVPENGKFTLLGNEVRIENNDAAIDAAADKVAIGLHMDCPIVFGRTKKQGIFSREPQNIVGSRVPVYPLVDQVFSASVNYNDQYRPARFATPEQKSTVTQSLLRASYQGLYLSAILRKRKELYITLIGGGSFGNPIELIVQELERAHNQWASHPASCLEACVLALYSPRDVQEVMRCSKGGTLGSLRQKM